MAMRVNILSDLLQKEKIIAVLEEDFLFVVSAIVNMIQRFFGELHEGS